METALDTLSSTDRGFVTWVAAMVRQPVEEVWEQLLATVQHGPGTTVEHGRLATLDLTPIGPNMRSAAGDARRLSLPFGGLDSLRVLDCSGLDVDVLDLRSLPGLRSLRCANNRIKELDLAHSAKLEQLDCSGNLLMLLDLRPAPLLREVDCSGNGLAALVLEEGSSLRTLDCSRNQLMVLDLPALPDLRELRCFRNALVRLAISTAPQLTHLDASRNDLEALELPNLPALRSLHCARNRLARLDLSGVPQLAELQCAGNYVEALDVTALRGLEQLHAHGNQLTSIAFGAHPRIAELDVSENRLESVDLSGCRSLEVLNCAGNELAALALNGLSRLCLLHCGDNVLHSLDLSALPGLAELDCAGNPIAELDVRANVELCRLASRRAHAEGPHVLATDVQQHRLRELREALGLGSGATEPDGMTPFELHEYVQSIRGRDAERRLIDAVRLPHCDLGTALLVYWTSSPHYYLRYASRAEVQEYEAPGWDLLATIEERVASDAFTSQRIWFDPRNDKQTRSVRGVDWTRDGRIVRVRHAREIPERMTLPSLARAVMS